LDSTLLYQEQINLEKDTKALMYGRVVNKKARHNLCFSDFNQSADFDKGKGTVIDFKTLPYLSELRNQLGSIFGSEFEKLNAEGNYYYDTKKTYIGWHGDAERKKVVGIRLGDDFPLHFRWYHKSSTDKESIHTINLQHGDIYIMSQKATGNDWKKRSIEWTLRHSAGFLHNIKD
jgi:alkylated DNA repair dioxygenase AlkB